MTCKDCIHIERCIDIGGGLSICRSDIRKCRCFKPKSRFIELPCAVGDTVWFIQGKRVYEGTVVLIRPFVHENHTTFHGNVEYKCEDPFYNDGRMMTHQISVVFQKYGENTIAYRTQEEAEKALERSEGK